jgi:DNA-binding response OmpR family regulator
VDTAADGSAGLIALCFNPYDLLITEHEMPKITGFELLRRARACPLHLPAIMISGFMPWDEADLESLIRPGAVMEKPFSFAALLANVRTLLNQGLS